MRTGFPDCGKAVATLFLGLALALPMPGWSQEAGPFAALPAPVTPGAVATSPPPPPAPAPVHRETLALRTGIDRLVLGPSWRNAEWGVLVVSLDHGDTLYSVNPTAPMAPASNVKLLTTAAALEALGPDYRFLTYVMTDGALQDGILHGDLILYGTGDPGLSSRLHPRRDEAFHHLIDQLVAAGIREVRGDVVADASFLPGPMRPEGWDPLDYNYHYSAAISALSYNENVLSMRVLPGLLGAPPTVQTIPPHAGFEVLNLASTVSGTAPGIRILREDPMAPVRIEGTVGVRSADVWRQMTVSDPTAFAGFAFHTLLGERGIEVNGTVRQVDRPGHSPVTRLSAPFAGKRGTSVLARHTSPPLQAYLEVINKQSNNLFAELVFRSVGRTVQGVGSPRASERAVKTVLEGIGLDTEGMVLMDGSGLSAGNRVTPQLFVSLLDRMSSRPTWDNYWASLPEAGRPRELQRMYRTAAVGNLRAKTGTIEQVSALSGIVRAADGERLAFSIVVNRTPSVARAKAVENQIGARLASFSRGLSLPLPAAVTVDAEAPAGPASGASGQTIGDQAGIADGSLGAQRHRVGTGENLTTIARRYGVGLDKLVAANPGLNPNRIAPGQWLVIPAVAEASGG